MMKKISYNFIISPVLAICLALIIVVLGLFSFVKLPINLYPKINTDIIQIETDYPGASPDIVQGHVTSYLQNAITNIDDIQYIESSSQEGISFIKIFLKMGANIDTIFGEVSQQVNSVENLLPPGAQLPFVEKVPASQTPMMIVGFRATALTREQVADYVRRYIQPVIQSINGISTVNVLGGLYAMRVWLDPNKMIFYNVSAEDVQNAISNNNTLTSSGHTKSGLSSMQVDADISLSSAKDFGNIVVKSNGNAPVRLRDIAKVTLGRRSSDINSFNNGMPAVNMFVQTSSGMNPLVVISHVNQVLSSLKKTLPYGIQSTVIYDATTYIRLAISNVFYAFIQSIIIVTLIVFLFLGSLRVVVVPLVAIPLSIMGACAIMHLFGYSINLLTLTAAVLATGLVVDDAIVVVENVQRHLSINKTPKNSAIDAMQEITFPIVAMTLTLVAIYLPFGFQNGIASSLFSEFAYSLAGAVLISGVVALTISPYMCANILLNHENKIQKSIDKIFNKIKMAYYVLLKKVVNRKKSIITSWMLLFALLIYGIIALPKCLAPVEDPGFLMVLGMAKNSSSSNVLIKSAKDIMRIYSSMKTIKNSMLVTGIPDIHQIMSFPILKPWGMRDDVQTLQRQLQFRLNQISGMALVTLIPSMLPGNQEPFPIEFVVMGHDYQSLYDVTQKILRDARKSGLFLFIKSDLAYDQPTAVFNINHNKMNDLGVTPQQVANLLSVTMSDNRIQQFDLNGQNYDVVTEVGAKFREHPDQLLSYSVLGNDDLMIPLSSFTTIDYKVKPYQLNQFQNQDAVMLLGEMRPPYSLSQGLNFLKSTALHYTSPEMNYSYAGPSLQLLLAGHEMILLFLLGSLVIYIILTLLFQSYVDALIILIGSAPMSLLGGVSFLFFGFADLNIYTEIALLTLVGLISKHGILIVKFANEFLSKGHSIEKSIFKATSLRLRPILMTTFAMFFGSLPLLFSYDSGSKSKFDMGLVLSSGIIFGTMMTLFILPVFYVTFKKKRDKTRDI